LLNSRLGLFTAALSGFNTLTEHPFSRSYGVILPSSLTRVISHTLGFSPRLPVSVCGTGTIFLARGFSWQCGIQNFGTLFPSPSQLSLTVSGFAYSPAYLLGRAYPTARLLYPPASPHHSNGREVVQEYQPVCHRLRLSASA
jgi:hypothetical protein